MIELPQEVAAAWDNRDGAIILTTVSNDGIANSIYATCVSKYDNATLVVADNYFDKTRQNIKHGNTSGVILFITDAGKAYQVKGTLEYCTEGAIFDTMKGWNDPKHPGHAAVALKVESVYSGAEKLA